MSPTPDILSSIKKCNEAGHLALAIYLVYGFPSLPASEEAFDLLLKYNTTIIECGLPVRSFDSSNMSEAISQAHRVASQAGLTDEQVLAFYGRYRPNLLMHQQDNQRPAVEVLAEQMQGLIDTVMTDNPAFLAELNMRQQKVESPRLFHFADAHFENSVRSLVFEQPDALIYLGCASQTGGELLPSAEIQAAVDLITAAAPKAKILCGMGIRTAQDVARIRQITGIHGIAIGTEAIRRLDQSMEDFENWLIEITQACS